MTEPLVHPRDYRRPIVVVALLAMATLTITDDGVGFDIERFRRTPAAGGVGLLGMRERVAYYRGHIEFRSRPQAGMRITLTIPIDDPDAAEGGEGGRITSVG